jgi:hypothetical protein
MGKIFTCGTTKGKGSLKDYEPQHALGIIPPQTQQIWANSFGPFYWRKEAKQ